MQLKEVKLEMERMGRIKQGDLNFLNVTIKRFSAMHSPWILKFLSLTTLFLLNIEDRVSHSIHRAKRLIQRGDKSTTMRHTLQTAVCRSAWRQPITSLIILSALYLSSSIVISKEMILF
jgi:hypothetical protein